MPKSKALERKSLIAVRMSAKEKAIIQQAAERAGLTVNALVYQACMEKAKQIGVFEGSRRKTNII